MAKAKTPAPKPKAASAPAKKAPAKQPPPKQPPTKAQKPKAPDPRKGPAVPFPGPAVQRKVAVGPADDSFEREANSVADRIVRGEPAPTISQIPHSGLAATAQREVAPIEQTDTKDDKTAQTLPVQRAEKLGASQGIPDESEVLAQRKTDDASKESEDTPKETAAVQRATAAAHAEDKDEGTSTVQKKSRDGSSEADMAGIAAEAMEEKGDGEPLDPGLRRSLESSMRTDLDDVRVHQDRRSEEAARGLNARAFTQGRDIWLGRGESPRDARLMGHEATHVVQQTRRGQQSVVQRDSKAKAEDTGDPNILKTTAGTIDTRKKTIELPAIRLPDAADKQTHNAKKLVATAPGSRGKTEQRDTWVKQIKGPGITTAVEELLPDQKSIALESGPRLFYLKLTGEKNAFIVGDRPTIMKLVRLPNWGDTAKHGDAQVDHVHEMQLGGDDKLANYQLLDGVSNRAYGNAIQQEIATMIKAAITPHVGKQKHWEKAPDPDDIRSNFKITFDGISDKKLKTPKPNLWWTRKQIAEEGAHLKGLKVLTAAELKKEKAKLVGSSTQLVLYTSAGAGKPKQIKIDDGGNAKKGLAQHFDIKGFKPKELNFTPGKGGSLTGELTSKSKVAKGELTKDITIQEIEGLQYTGRLVTDDLARKLSFNVRGASPVTITSAAFTEDRFEASGQVNLTPPLFKSGVTMDIAIEGDDVSLSKTFTAGDFTFPGPVQVTNAALTLRAGTGGLQAEGNVDFEINGVGTGRVKGLGDISKGFSVEGQFDFDKKLFNDADASIKLRYAEDKLSGEGTLKIGKDKVKGVKSASLAVKVDGDAWSADGVVEPDVPGVKQGTMSVKFDPKGGLEITGRLEFGEGVPRLKNGFLEAKVTKKDEAYSVEGQGAAELDIPGGSGGVKAEYRDGLFSAQASLAYEKGLAKGSITAGITNMAMGEDGKPTGEPSKDLIVFGSGSITIRFTPWLQGTAGIQIAPDGKMVITGRVELPSAIDVFPKKEIDKKLLSASIDIPIFGVSVAGQRIGIFLNIEGKLTANASIGPGQLRDVGVEITYDPEDESNAKITGTAKFVVPGEAGLKLAISGSIGAGIPIVSARAGLEVAAGLGIRGEAVAEATVEWSPATGINLDASVSLMAEPRFTVELTGFALVEADLLFTEIELYSERWNLAKFEYGSGLRLGAKLPVKVTNGVMRDLSLSDVEFIVPEIDPIDIAKDLVGRVV